MFRETGARLASPLFFVFLLAAQPQDLALKSRQAKELMAAERYAEAIPIYAELVRAIPNNPGLILNLGMAQQMAGQHREAIRQFDAALKLQPNLYPAWASLGASYVDLGEPAKAIAPLEKALALAPREPGPRQMLGEALYSTGRFEGAARQFRQLSEMEPGNPRAWYGLGESYEALAQRAFERLDKLGPGSAWWLAVAAETQLSQQQYGAAFGLYREALVKMPAMRGVHAALAEIYRNTGHPDWAAAEEKKEPRAPDCARSTPECAFRAGRFLEAVRGAQPPTLESYYWQCRAYNELARQAFSRLAQLPPSAEMHRFRARLESGRGRHLEAANQLREALKLTPRDPQLRIELAAALRAGRDHQGAQAVLEELLKADPEAGPLNFMYGDTLLSLEQPEKAIPYLEKALRRDPKQLRVRGSLGVAYARTGQAERAIPHLKAALELDTDGSLHYQLARAYQAAGQAELAKPILRKYQELQQRAQPEKPQITPP